MPRGRQQPAAVQPPPDKPLRYLLEAPFAASTQWQSATTACLLMRRNDFPRVIRRNQPDATMNYQIEAVDEAVQTPAGGTRTLTSQSWQ